MTFKSNLEVDSNNMLQTNFVLNIYIFFFLNVLLKAVLILMNIYIRKCVYEKALILFAALLCPVLDYMETIKDKRKGVEV